ncbi:hypothetical protein [Caldimonas sp.]|nr:hypothetical protein [Caldimonas manganoxidans]
MSQSTYEKLSDREVRRVDLKRRLNLAGGMPRARSALARAIPRELSGMG